MKPDEGGVINVTKSAEGLVGHLLKSYLLKVLHDEAGNDKGQWQTHSHTISLFIELATKAEKGRSQCTVEQS